MIEKNKSKKYFRWAPAIIWMAFIFYLSSGPTTLITGTSLERFLILKTFHLIEYSILLLTIIYAVNSPTKSIFISYLYSLSDEIHQYFVPGRNARFHDTIIDLVGIFIGLFIFQLINKTLPKLRNKISLREK